jgi:hypothetical protein
MEEENIIMDVLERRAYDVAKRWGIIQKVKQKVLKESRSRETKSPKGG